LINFKLLAESYSQSGQESFVVGILDNLLNGFYLEIGAFHSKELSNTFLLESRFGWKGLAIEIVKKRSKEYNRNRENPCIRADATQLDYSELFLIHNVPRIIDYLQVDIEPATNSLTALKALPISTNQFRVITFEHDIYADSQNLGIQEMAFVFLQSHGYHRVAKNVKNSGLSYEDWYIHPELIHKKFTSFSLPSDTEFTDFFIS
jgi:hypothetical protein